MPISKKLIKTIYRFIGFIVCIIATAFFLKTLIHNISFIDWQQLNNNIWIPFIVSIFICFVAMFVNSLAWTALLRSLVGLPSYSIGSSIFLLSQIGKYLPGNMAHHLGRIVFITRFGAPTIVVTESIFLELGAAILVASWIAVIGAGPWLNTELLGQYSLAPQSFRTYSLIALILASFIAVCILLRQRNIQTTGSSSNRLIAFSSVILAYIFAFTTLGYALFLLILGVTASPQNIFWITVIFSVAWVVGLVTPGAPGGIGVREALITVGLTSCISEGSASIVALIFRVVTIFSDGLSFGIGILFLKKYLPYELKKFFFR